MRNATMTPQPSQRQFSTAEQVKLKPASSGLRIIAFLLDSIISTVAAVMINLFLEPIFSSMGTLGALLNLSYFILFVPIGYWIALTLYFKATPGKLMLGLRIVPTDRKEDLTFGQMFLREVIGRWISGVPLLIGYLWSFFNDEKKTWHDMLSDTRVVEYK